MAVNMSKDDLLKMLDDIRARVASDSYTEGAIEWHLPDDAEAGQPFDVFAGYWFVDEHGRDAWQCIGETSSATREARRLQKILDSVRAITFQVIGHITDESDQRAKALREPLTSYAVAVIDTLNGAPADVDPTLVKRVPKLLNEDPEGSSE